MRKYGAHCYDGERNHGRVEIGATHATVAVNRSSTPIIARILDRTVDPASGAIVALVLDRLVVPHHTSAVGGWQVSGAYVTQLSRDVPRCP